MVALFSACALCSSGCIGDAEKIIVVEEVGEYLRMDEQRGIH